MLSYHDLKSNSRVLRAFTSLDPAEFEMLLIPFEKAWNDYINRYYIHKKSRKRRYGGGRKPRLVAIEDKLLFILFYFKVYPLQAVLARLFGMSQGRANEWIYKGSLVISGVRNYLIFWANKAYPDRSRWMR
jgi:hypothetical protein